MHARARWAPTLNVAGEAPVRPDPAVGLVKTGAAGGDAHADDGAVEASQSLNAAATASLGQARCTLVT